MFTPGTKYHQCRPCPVSPPVDWWWLEMCSFAAAASTAAHTGSSQARHRAAATRMSRYLTKIQSLSAWPVVTVPASSPTPFLNIKHHSPHSTFRRGQQNYAFVLTNSLWEMPVILAVSSSGHLRNAWSSSLTTQAGSLVPPMPRSPQGTGTWLWLGHSRVQTPTSTPHCALLGHQHSGLAHRALGKLHSLPCHSYQCFHKHFMTNNIVPSPPHLLAVLCQKQKNWTKGWLQHLKNTCTDHCC